MKQFFHYLKLHDLVDRNVASDLNYPKIEKTVPQFLTVAEYNRMLQHFTVRADGFIGLRNLNIILMLGLLGLRTNTIVTLDVENVDLISGLIRIIEKGNRRRMAVLPKIICTTLQPYHAQISHDKGPLYITRRGKRISPRTLQNVFRTAALQLQIEKPLHARLFRHTAATHLNKVAGTSITQCVLGHSQRVNTLKYAHLNPDVYAVYMQKHPFMQYSF